MIQFQIIRRVIGVMLMVFALSLIPPIIVSVIYQDGQWFRFVMQSLATAVGGYLLFRNTFTRREPKTRDGIVIVVLIWTLYSLIGALPYVWSLQLSYTDAVFEAVSGLTTTGASVLTGLDHMPKSVLWYRQQTHLLGGMGVLILAVAILPMFNIGGMKLYKAEATGPMKDDKLAPRIAHTARLLFMVYIGLIAAVALGYWLAGMNAFDALTHSFATVATGGFSNYDASLGHFNSLTIELIAVIGMLAGALNFGLLFVIWRNKHAGLLLQDQESRTFLGIVLVATLLVALELWRQGSYESIWQAARLSLFHVISSITTTGFVTVDLSGWPSFTGHFVFLLAFIGGCSGSTSGGMKTLRFFLLFKQVSREAKQLVQPGIVAPVKYNGRIVSDTVANGIWGFFALFVSTALLFQFLYMAAGLDFATAFTTTAATLGNQGFGTNNPQLGFAQMSDFAKWLCSLAMLAGRLEIFTFFVLFTPIFWRRF